MDVPTIITTPGLALTSDQRDADFAIITGHAITRADFADTFAWAVDIDMDGFGFTTVRHMNGYVVFADQFLDGDDAAAIQAALLFLDNVGGGIVIVPPGTYDMDDGIELISNVWIYGLPGAIFQRTQAGNTIHGEDVEYVRISGIHFQGGAMASEGIYIEGVNHLIIEDNIFGSTAANTQRHDNGCIAVTAGAVITTPTDVMIRSNIAYNEGPFIMVDTCHEVSIIGNSYMTPGTPAGPAWCVDTYYCDRLLIEGNYLWNYSDSYAGCWTAIAVRGPGTGSQTTNFTIRNNTAVGCKRGANVYHVCYIMECEFGLIEGNEFWNAGSSAGAGGAPWQCDCLNVVSNCNSIVIDDNVLTSVDVTNGGPGTIGSRYGCYIDTSTCTKIVLKDNFCECVSDTQANTQYHHGNCDTGTPGGAGYNIAGANPTEVYRKGSVIIEDQQVVNTVSAAAQSFTVAVLGLRAPGTDADRAAQVDCCQITLEIATLVNAQAIALNQSVGWQGDNLINCRASAALSSTSDQVHVRVHA